MVDMVDVNSNDNYSIKYSTKLFIVNTMMVTKYFLMSRNFQILDQFQFTQKNI